LRASSLRAGHERRDSGARTGVSAAVVLAAALATAFATGLGAAPFLVAGKPQRSWIGVANGLAAGFMLGASAGQRLPVRWPGSYSLRALVRCSGASTSCMSARCRVWMRSERY
jgi:hypothetical protein